MRSLRQVSERTASKVEEETEKETLFKTEKREELWKVTKALKTAAEWGGVRVG